MSAGSGVTGGDVCVHCHSYKKTAKIMQTLRDWWAWGWGEGWVALKHLSSYGLKTPVCPKCVLCSL